MNLLTGTRGTTAFSEILKLTSNTVPSGAGDANYSELLLIGYLSHFNDLMEIYRKD